MPLISLQPYLGPSDINWVTRSPSVPFSTSNADASYAADGLSGIAVDSLTSKVYLTSDGGITWDIITPIGATTAFRVSRISDDGKHLYAIATSGTVHASHDYGVTWVKLSGTLSNFRMSRSAKYVLYGFNNGRLYVSNDYGDTATARQTKLGGMLYDFAANYDGTALFASSEASDRLQKSVDGGVTWTNAAVMAGFKYLTCSDNGQIIATTSNSSINKGIWVSIDGGASFTKTANSPNTTPVCMSSDGRVIVINSGAANIVLISRDYGSTWTRSSLPAGASMAANNRGGSWISPDGSEYRWFNYSCFIN